MAFIGQFLLSDVPGLEHLTSHLYSFHYCDECSLAGDMSFGWAPPETSPQPIPFPSLKQRLLNLLGIAPIPTIEPWQDSQSYDITIFSGVDELESDGLGAAAESPVLPQALQTRRVSEIPSDPDYPEDLPDPREIVHVGVSKIGGWPTWVQDRQVPPANDGSPMELVAQLDYHLAKDASWGGGGFAYLFLDVSSPGPPVGELVIQTT